MNCTEKVLNSDPGRQVEVEIVRKLLLVMSKVLAQSNLYQDYQSRSIRSSSGSPEFRLPSGIGLFTKAGIEMVSI